MQSAQRIRSCSQPQRTVGNIRGYYSVRGSRGSQGGGHLGILPALPIDVKVEESPPDSEKLIGEPVDDMVFPRCTCGRKRARDFHAEVVGRNRRGRRIESDGELVVPGGENGDGSVVGAQTTGVQPIVDDELRTGIEPGAKPAVEDGPKGAVASVGIPAQLKSSLAQNELGIGGAKGLDFGGLHHAHAEFLFFESSIGHLVAIGPPAVEQDAASFPFGGEGFPRSLIDLRVGAQVGIGALQKVPFIAGVQIQLGGRAPVHHLIEKMTVMGVGSSRKLNARSAQVGGEGIVLRSPRSADMISVGVDTRNASFRGGGAPGSVGKLAFGGDFDLVLSRVVAHDLDGVSLPAVVGIRPLDAVVAGMDGIEHLTHLVPAQLGTVFTTGGRRIHGGDELERAAIAQDRSDAQIGHEKGVGSDHPEGLPQRKLRPEYGRFVLPANLGRRRHGHVAHPGQADGGRLVNNVLIAQGRDVVIGQEIDAQVGEISAR